MRQWQLKPFVETSLESWPDKHKLINMHACCLLNKQQEHSTTITIKLEHCTTKQNSAEYSGLKLISFFDTTVQWMISWSYNEVGFAEESREQ